MARKTFTAKEKAKAVRLMQEGQLTLKQISQKFGCSVSALQLWKKGNDAKSQDTEEWDESEWEGWEEETPETHRKNAQSACGCKSSQPSTKDTDGVLALQRGFWNKNFRGVDMLLSPKDVSAEEAVKLVNEALHYAHEQIRK